MHRVLCQRGGPVLDICPNFVPHVPPGKKPKDRNSGGFLSRLVGGLMEDEPYVPFRERYADNRPATPSTEETEEADFEEQQTVRQTRLPIPETLRSDIKHEQIPMQQSHHQQLPWSQTTPNRGMTGSVTCNRNPMTRNSMVIDNGTVVDGMMRFRSASTFRNSSTFHNDQSSPTATEFVNQNVTPVRRLIRQHHSPTDRGLELRQYGVEPDKGKSQEIGDTEAFMHSRRIHEPQFFISYPESSNVPKKSSRRSNLPSPDEYLSIPNNPFLPLPTSPEPVTELPRIYPDKDGFFRTVPTPSSSSASQSTRIQNSTTMSAMPNIPVFSSSASNGLQNSSTMPASPRNRFPSSRPIMSTSPSGRLRDVSFSDATIKEVQSASSSNYDISVVDGSSFDCDEIPVVVQAPPQSSPLNKRVMQLSVTTPERQMSPPSEVRKMRISATATSEMYSVPIGTGYDAAAQFRESPRVTSPNEELRIPVIPQYVASGQSRRQNILHNDPIQARRYEGGRRKPRAAVSNHQEQPPMLDPKPETRPAIPPQQQSQYPGSVRIEDGQEIHLEENHVEKQQQWQEKQKKLSGLLGRGASKLGAGGFKKSISTLFKGHKTPKVALSVGNLKQQPGDQNYHQPQTPEAQNQAAATSREFEANNQRSVTVRHPEVPAMQDRYKTSRDNHQNAGARTLQDQQHRQIQERMNAEPSNNAGSSQLTEIPISFRLSPPEVPLQASPARFPVLHSPPGTVQEPSSGKICQSSQSIPKPWEPAVNPQRACLTAQVEAEICLDNEDIDTAIEWYESIKDDAVYTNQPHVFFNLGQLNMLKSDHDTAEDYFRQAVDFDEYLLPGYMQLAYLAYWDEDFDLADSYWEKALHCLVGGRKEVDYETVGLAYTCSYTDIWWNRSAAQAHEHGMEPSKVPFGAIFRVPGFQANALECVLGSDAVRERRPWEFGGEGRVIYSAGPEGRKSEKKAKP
ncbi:hypothetical protein BZA77DRAFT_297753 [Pyronema omphalodes]|nr:hypothetical protein BZA77DRAFT_297753 [Pyronema omphalodes]